LGLNLLGKRVATLAEAHGPRLDHLLPSGGTPLSLFGSTLALVVITRNSGPFDTADPPCDAEGIKEALTPRCGSDWPLGALQNRVPLNNWAECGACKI